jgi:hypothetical protein
VAAALIIGAVSIITFLVFNRSKNPDISQKNTPDERPEKKNPHFAKYSPEIIAENMVMNAIDPARLGFAGQNALSYNVELQNIRQQIDTLNKWYEVNDEACVHARQKNEQIDSLLSCINTYLFYEKERKLVLKLGEKTKVDHLIAPDQLHRRPLFIELNNRFYEIKVTKDPLKLLPVTDKQLIESLQKIVFQNS